MFYLVEPGRGLLFPLRVALAVASGFLLTLRLPVSVDPALEVAASPFTKHRTVLRSQYECARATRRMTTTIICGGIGAVFEACMALLPVIVGYLDSTTM